MADIEVAKIGLNWRIEKIKSGDHIPEEFTLPDQTGNTGKVLTTDGTATSWQSGGSGSGVIAVTATAPLVSSGGLTPDISSLINTNKLLGRGTAGAGVIEEITLGTNLSFTGTTLNASGSGSIPRGFIIAMAVAL